VEFERKRATMRAVRLAADEGLDLLALAEAQPLG
jgi:hypothetical protein